MDGRPASHAQDRPRLPSLTSLRWFAAFAVFLIHTHALFRGTSWQGAVDRVSDGGRAGVSFFFLLSGFVLAWVWKPGDDRAAFYLRRVGRVVPAYLVAATAAWFIHLLIDHETGIKELAANSFAFTLLQSWIPIDAVYFADNGSGWSLSDEMFFYALFPFIVPVLMRLSRAQLWRALGGLALIALGIPLAVHTSSNSDFGHWLVYISPPVRLLEFAIGIVLCALLRAGVRLPLRPELVAVPAVALLLVDASEPTWVAAVALMLVPLMALLFSAAQADIDGRTSRALRSGPLIRLGEWSYAFYLVHGLVAGFALRAADGHATVGLAIALWLGTLAVTLVLSWALFTYVERPVERRVRALARRRERRRELVHA